MEYRYLLLPALWIIAGFLIGLLLEKVLLQWLRKTAEKTAWLGDNIIFASLRGIPVFWGVASGIYLATLNSTSSETINALLNQALLVALLWSLTIIAARLAAGFTSAYAGRDGTFLPPTSIIPGLIRLLVYVVGILFILSTLSISIAPFLTALGVGGLAVALALQDTLTNVFAGLYLIASRQIKPGDYVQLESKEEGYIVDINWRSTTVRTVLDNMIIVPNARFSSSIVTNFYLKQKAMRVRIGVAVAYGTDLDKVEQITLEVAREVLQELAPGVRHPEPELYLHTFGEFSLNFTVILRAREFYEQYRLRHIFMKRLIARYNVENIEIPFPIKEFEMELSTGGLEAGGTGRLTPSDRFEPVAEADDPMRGEAGLSDSAA